MLRPSPAPQRIHGLSKRLLSSFALLVSFLVSKLRAINCSIMVGNVRSLPVRPPCSEWSDWILAKHARLNGRKRETCCGAAYVVLRLHGLSASAASKILKVRRVRTYDARDGCSEWRDWVWANMPAVNSRSGEVRCDAALSWPQVAVGYLRSEPLHVHRSAPLWRSRSADQRVALTARRTKFCRQCRGPFWAMPLPNGRVGLSGAGRNNAASMRQATTCPSLGPSAV